MRVEQIYTSSPLRNFTYLVSTANGSLYCIDPWDGQQVIHHLKGRKLAGIINTHEHGDHIRGNDVLEQTYNCPIFVHKNAKGKIPRASNFLGGGEKIPLDGDGDGAYLEVMDTPGHTMAHLSLLLVEGGRGVGVFTGDTLFNAGVGNCYNGGDPRVLYGTIVGVLGNLSGNCQLYPGHEYMGNNLAFVLSISGEHGNRDAEKLLGRWKKVDFEREKMLNNMEMERKVNPFLRLQSREIRDNLPKSIKTDEEVFLQLRQLRDKW